MKGPSSGRVPPSGSVRRSQLLLGSGPGAIVDLVDDAVIMGGLDTWRYPNEHEGFIPETRLQDKVQAMLVKTERWGHPHVRLRMPPPCVESDPSLRVGIPALRFPRWYLCQNPECRSILPWKALEKGQHVCRFGTRKSFPVVPIRFVTACIRGHVQDIDWRWFVHRGHRVGLEDWCHRRAGSGKPEDPLGAEWTSDLYLMQVGTSGDLTDYVLGCRKCGARRGFQDLAPPGALGKCLGRRPWLGFSSTEDCDEDARLLTRTASNMYFPSVVSALSIPDSAEELRAAVEGAWAFVSVATRETLPIFRQLPDAQRHLSRFSDAAVLGEIERRRLGIPVPTPPLRELEAAALMAAPDEVPGVLPTPGERWHARRVHLPDMPPFLDRVVLVKSLTEVRAQVGFTRIDAQASDAEGEYAIEPRTAPLAMHVDWVPAVEIQGEGIYLAFDGAALDRWTTRPAVRARVEQFRRALYQHNRDREGPDTVQRFPGERHIMLHTLSHLLITSISLECGYPATAIRERLYCATVPNPLRGPGQPDELTVRAGILLYTGTPGSEGTLGGLVEVGRAILHHLRRAVEIGRLCSNDPVCAQHRPDDGQEGRHREGAACHGCVLIGEPSCERRNLDLDRALVVPTVADGGAAFLGEWAIEGLDEASTTA